MTEKVKENHLEQVLEFHQTFDQVIGENPHFPTPELIAKRMEYMMDELTELAEACGHDVLGRWQRMLFNESQRIHNMAENKREKLQPNLKEALDALGDIQYFLSGTVIVFGMQDIFASAFKDVHESNMSKACKSYEEAEATRKDYSDIGISTEIKTKTLPSGEIKYLILRKPDLKVLKSINYHKVELDKYVTKSL